MRIIDFKRKRRSGSLSLRNAAVLVATVISVACFILRLGPQVLVQREAIALTTAGFIMPDRATAFLHIGPMEENIDQNPEAEHSQPEESSEAIRDPAEVQNSSPSSSAQESNSQTSSAQSQVPAINGSGAPIQELAIQSSGVQYENTFVENTNQNHEIDVRAELGRQPAAKIQTDSKLQVLIYHAHTTETYLLREATSVPPGTGSRGMDTTRSVMTVGNAIVAQLETAGVGVVHDTTIHGSPVYNGSYNRSKQTMAKNLKQYPSIQVTPDIHRDAMTTSNGT